MLDRLLCAVAVVVLVTGTLPAAAQGIVEYPLPTAQSSPGGITAGPDGAIWFAEVFVGKIGRITTAGRITEFPLPAGAQPRELVIGADGNLWYPDISRNKIARMTTAGGLTEFAIPRGAVWNIAAAPDGSIWFAGILDTRGDGYIGRLDPNGSITEFAVGAHVGDLVFGADGNLWFTDFYGNRIARMTTGGSVTPFVIPTVDSRPLTITPGADGALWFTELAGNKIGRITTTGAITEYVIPGQGTSAFDLVAGPDGAIWFASWAGFIGRVGADGAVRIVAVPSGRGPIGITSGPDGALWFTSNVANVVGRVWPYVLASPVPLGSSAMLAALAAAIAVCAVVMLRHG